MDILDIKKAYIATITKKNLKKYENLLENNKLKKNLREKIKIGLCGGVFDMVHLGHIKTLFEMKKKCDLLVVAIARDQLVFNLKKRKPIHLQKHRKEIVENLKPVDVVILGQKNIKNTIKKISPDIIFFGYDQDDSLDTLGIKKQKIKKKVMPKVYKSKHIIEKTGI